MGVGHYLQHPSNRGLLAGLRAADEPVLHILT